MLNEFIPVIIAVAVIALVVFGVVGGIMKNLVKVPPNQLATFSGSGEMKMVTGGSKFKIPGVHRVDFMPLRPFEVDVEVRGVHSIKKVPVNVTAVATVRFGQTDEMRKTAVSQWLDADRPSMDSMITNILAGALRSVIANMTVEELHESRDALQQRSMDEAADAFGPFGMELQTFVVQSIADDNGYMDALGQGEIAEAKARADIRTADAERDALVKSSEADKAGQTARAEADQAIDEANRARDLRRAEIKGETEAEMAKADQAGPLAEARAKREVGVAEEEAAAARQEAAVNVERQRTLRAREAQKADTIVPAEAAREAADLNAEAARVMTVTSAEAEAQATRDRGAADAEARTALADARRAELEAEAEGDRARRLAEADGEKALMEGRAAGEQALAEALASNTPEVLQYLLAPRYFDMLPLLMAELARPVGEIGNISVIGTGGGDGDDGSSGGLSGIIGDVATVGPIGLRLLKEVLQATGGVTGMDSGFLAGAADALTGGSPNGQPDEVFDTVVEPTVDGDSDATD